MASITQYPAKDASPGLVKYYGYFYPNGNGTVTDGYTPRVTPARSGVGLATLTLDQSNLEIVSAKAEMGQATVTDFIVRLGSVTTSVVNLVCWDISSAAAAEWPAANANTKVFYEIVARNTEAVV